MANLFMNFSNGNQIIPYNNVKDIIGSLIRYHGLPIWFSEKRNPEMELIKCSLRCNIEHLSYFAECDFRGRICGDLEESLYKIELFRESAQNLNCFNKPFELSAKALIISVRVFTSTEDSAAKTSAEKTFSVPSMKKLIFEPLTTLVEYFSGTAKSILTLLICCIDPTIC